MTLEEMTAQRDALLAARYRGVRTVEYEGRRVATHLRRRDQRHAQLMGAEHKVQLTTIKGEVGTINQATSPRKRFFSGSSSAR